MSTMKPQPVRLDGVLRFALVCYAVSFLAAIAFVSLGGRYSFVREPSAGVGIMAALVGSGVALWAAIRARDRKLYIVTLVSLLPLAFWSVMLYVISHARYA
jgi:hypothetical protein